MNMLGNIQLIKHLMQLSVQSTTEASIFWVTIEVQSTMDISKIDISKYLRYSKVMVWIHLLFLFTFQLFISQTTDISK